MPDIYRIESFPGDFLKVHPSSKTVHEIMAKCQYPTTAAKLKTLPDTGKKLLPLDHLDPATIPADIPPYIIMQFKHLSTAEEQHHL